ncbi:MAG TPA: hypothetical protein ENI78_01590 [Euryarchaeota archaeon]|nr:hypothetical protein [Euryarchaeota archaeon]
MTFKWTVENLLPMAIAEIVTLIILWILTLYKVITTGYSGITGIIFSTSVIIWITLALLMRGKKKVV